MMHTRLCQGRRTNEPNVVPIQGMCTFPFTFLLLSTVRSFSTLLSALSNVDFHFLPICLCFPRIVGASRALSESSQRVHAEILVDLLVAAVNPTLAMPMATVQVLSVSLVSGSKTCPTVPSFPKHTQMQLVPVASAYTRATALMQERRQLATILSAALTIPPRPHP